MEYEIVKPVSIKALEDAGACESELHRFAFLACKRWPSLGISELSWGNDADVFSLIDLASQCTDGIRFLLSRGFIRVKEEELKACPLCGFSASREYSQRRHDFYDAVECTNKDCGIFVTGPDCENKWNRRV